MRSRPSVGAGHGGPDAANPLKQLEQFGRAANVGGQLASRLQPTVKRTRSRLIVSALVIVVVMILGFVVILVPILGLESELGSNAGDTTQIGRGSPIPSALVPVFNEAGSVFDVDPYLLASVAYQESTFGSRSSRTPNSSGCVGFMQTCIGGAGGDSWDSSVVLTGHPKIAITDRNAYTLGARPADYPDRSSREPDYNDPFDAVMAAAVELRGKVGGATIPHLDDTAQRALCGYYGACADSLVNYAQDVLDRARQWEAESALLPSAAGAPAGSPTLGSANGTLGQRIVHFASEWIGYPYQWAGGDDNGPTYGTTAGGTHDLGFDCSGLTKFAVYQATGGRVDLDHNAAVQYDSPRLTHVAYAQLAPGDLVFFDGLGHVGVYIGGGKMIDAPQTWVSPGVRGKVEIDDISSGFFHDNYVGGARVTG